jgi:hypothetical protein
MPSDERVRLDNYERSTPIEQPAQDSHQPSGGIVRAVRLNRAPPEKGQPFSEEEILGRQHATGPSQEEDRPTEVDQHLANGPEAVN